MSKVNQLAEILEVLVANELAQTLPNRERYKVLEEALRSLQTITEEETNG